MSAAPIYPDPELISNEKAHRGRSGAVKFHKLQELANPIDASEEFKRVDLTTVASAEKSYPDRPFRGKSIDFNMRHTMAELQNQDLRDHNIIDTYMYIYYGSNVTLRKSLGGSIIIVGTVFALAAQILAIIFALLRNRLVHS